MKGKNENQERIKVEKYMNRLYNNSVKKVGSTAVIAIFQFLSVITYMMPVQAFSESDTPENPMFVPAMLIMFSLVIVSMRASLFREYTEGQKARKMTDILKLYPISKRELWKAKMRNITSFMAKMTGVGLAFQIATALLGYKQISWMNFVYIILCVFVLPIIGDVLIDIINGDIFKE